MVAININEPLITANILYQSITLFHMEGVKGDGPSFSLLELNISSS
jgi:hypothetical protein